MRSDLMKSGVDRIPHRALFRALRREYFSGRLRAGREAREAVP
mgnify:CR=1 FL=1